MESYVERWAREQREQKAAERQKVTPQEKPQKPQKGQKVRLSSVYGEMKKEGQKDGTDTRSEGQEAPTE